MKRLFVPVLAWLCQASTAAPPPVDCAAAEATLDKRPFQTWRDSFAYFGRFHGQCADGALAQSLASLHTRLLDKPTQFGLLKSLAAKHPDYRGWVLRGVFYNPEEPEGPSNTACRLQRRFSACSPSDQPLCGAIVARIGPNQDYLQACSADTPWR